MANFNRQTAKVWMKSNKCNWIDPKTGEVLLTGLVEDCAAYFGMNDEGGPLDDESHWIWEIATEV